MLVKARIFHLWRFSCEQRCFHLSCFLLSLLLLPFAVAVFFLLLLSVVFFFLPSYFPFSCLTHTFKHLQATCHLSNVMISAKCVHCSWKRVRFSSILRRLRNRTTGKWRYFTWFSVPFKLLFPLFYCASCFIFIQINIFKHFLY